VDAQPTAGASLRRFLALYGQGASFAIPMLLQIVSITALGYGLWTDVGFTTAQATAVSLATLGSLIVTGGFVQAIGRLGHFYRDQESHLLAKQVLGRVILGGGVAGAVVGGAGFAGNLLLGWFPPGLAGAALVYYVLLCGFWLVLAVLYALQRRLAVSASTAAGIAVVGVLRALTPLPIYPVQWLGLLAAIGVAFTWGWRLLRRSAAAVSEERRLERLPRPAILASAAAPYFAYGILYYAFLFADRLVGWSAPGSGGPFPVTFRTPYELGLDWALLALVAMIALLEYTITVFSATIVPVQQRFAGVETGRHNAYFVRFYARQLAGLVVLSVASGLLVHAGVLALRRLSFLGEVGRALGAHTTRAVYPWAVVGDSLFVWGLLNGALFFSLSRPHHALRPLAAGLAVGLAVGIVASRTGPYWTSVTGLTAGALVFAGLTTRNAVRVLRQLDYYYYAAF
jgi:uncharacterized membrane protein